MASSAATQQPSRLQNVEAQRIMAILEETHSKLELLSRVPPLQLPDEGDLRLVLGPEVLQVLQEQAMLEQQYEMVSAPQYEQRQDGDGGAAALPDFETLDDELRHSTRVVCRMVREAPAIVERLHEFGGADAAAVSEAMEKFLATFAELKSQTFAKLSTSVEEEKSKEDWFLEISAREEKAAQQQRQLQKEIKVEKQERERQVSAREETIRKLREELDAIQTGTRDEIKALEDETKKTEGDDKARFTTQEDALQEELAKLRTELAEKRQSHKESEEGLRRKKMKNEAEVQNWIAMYDRDMEDKARPPPPSPPPRRRAARPRTSHPDRPRRAQDREIQALRAIYEEERKEMLRLEDYFNKLMAEKEAQLAEERKKAEENARQQAQQATLSKAATMLQKMWRGRIARREMEKKKSGKGGKGGKKKK